MKMFHQRRRRPIDDDHDPKKRRRDGSDIVPDGTGVRVPLMTADSEPPVEHRDGRMYFRDTRRVSDSLALHQPGNVSDDALGLDPGGMAALRDAAANAYDARDRRLSNAWRQQPPSADDVSDGAPPAPRIPPHAACAGGDPMTDAEFAEVQRKSEQAHEQHKAWLRNAWRTPAATPA